MLIDTPKVYSNGPRFIFTLNTNKSCSDFVSKTFILYWSDLFLVIDHSLFS